MFVHFHLLHGAGHRVRLRHAFAVGRADGRAGGLPWFCWVVQTLSCVRARLDASLNGSVSRDGHENLPGLHGCRTDGRTDLNPTVAAFCGGCGRQIVVGGQLGICGQLAAVFRRARRFCPAPGFGAGIQAGFGHLHRLDPCLSLMVWAGCLGPGCSSPGWGGLPGQEIAVVGRSVGQTHGPSHSIPFHSLVHSFIYSISDLFHSISIPFHLVHFHSIHCLPLSRAFRAVRSR